MSCPEMVGSSITPLIPGNIFKGKLKPSPPAPPLIGSGSRKPIEEAQSNIAGAAPFGNRT